MARKPSAKLKRPHGLGKKYLAIIIGILATLAGSATVVLLGPLGPSRDVSIQVQLENASVFVGDVVIGLRHIGGDDVDLSDLRVVVSDNTNSVGISGDGFTVSPESGKFGLNSVLTARRQTPFENSSVVTIELIYQPTGKTLYTIPNVTLAGIVNPSIVRIENYQLSVDGEPFVIKGVNYSPIPVGQSSGYNWWSNSNICQNDFPMIKEMGANTIRTYDATKATEEALDAAYRNDLHVIMTYWVDWGADFSNSAIRQSKIGQFVAMIQEWKDHPAVLMWGFGNEVNQHVSRKSDWYTFLQEAAQAAHDVDSNHPIIAVEAEIGDLGRSEYSSDDASLGALDAWGVDIYRGASLGIFSAYQAKSDKPVVLTEWGCDALDVRTMTEGQGVQASYVGSLWSEIESHLGTVGGRCLGGAVFEWCDEWWKAGSPSTHDKTGQWSNNAYYDYVAGKNNMNEEWWGITSVSSGTYEKTPREAYYVLKDLWAENVVPGFTLTPSPASGSATPGGSIDLTLYILPSGGYSEPISLSTGDLPGGITIDFDPENGALPSTSTASISVGSGVESGTYPLTIVGTGADGKTGTCTYELKVGMFVDKVLYSDSVSPPSGAVVWTWSGADWGGPAGTFEDNYLGESPPEGNKCFKTTSGANWDGNLHTNYAGWGIFYTNTPDNIVDLSDYNYLKFWVKTPEDLSFEIERNNHAKSGAQISSYGWDGTNTWQEIVVPKGAFERVDFTKIFGPFLVTVVEPSTTFFIDNVRWTI